MHRISHVKIDNTMASLKTLFQQFQIIFFLNDIARKPLTKTLKLDNKF